MAERALSMHQLQMLDVRCLGLLPRLVSPVEHLLNTTEPESISKFRTVEPSMPAAVVAAVVADATMLVPALATPAAAVVVVSVAERVLVSPEQEALEERPPRTVCQSRMVLEQLAELAADGQLALPAPVALQALTPHVAQLELVVQVVALVLPDRLDRDHPPELVVQVVRPYRISVQEQPLLQAAGPA